MDHKRLIKTGFHRSGPVFLSSKIKVDRSQSRSFNFGPKDRTGPDLQTLTAVVLVQAGNCKRDPLSSKELKCCSTTILIVKFGVNLVTSRYKIFTNHLRCRLNFLGNPTLHQNKSCVDFMWILIELYSWSNWRLWTTKNFTV